jgi:type IV pilus assembly protein PilV
MIISAAGNCHGKYYAGTSFKTGERIMFKTFQKINGNLRNERGFTLLEVIMAVSILTIGLLAVASMQISAMRGNTMSMTYTESTEMVQDRVDKLLIRDLDDALLTDKAGEGIVGRDYIGVNADGSNLINLKYNVYWNVAVDWAGGTVAEGGKQVIGVNTIRVIITNKRDIPIYSFDMLKNRIKS